MSSSSTTYVASCGECPFAGTIDLDCHARRPPQARKPSAQHVVASIYKQTPPPALCPLRVWTITIALTPPLSPPVVHLNLAELPEGELIVVAGEGQGVPAFTSGASKRICEACNGSRIYPSPEGDRPCGNCGGRGVVK